MLLHAEIAGFLTSLTAPGEPDRVLATLLHIRAAGDGRPESDDDAARHLVQRHRGQLILSAPDSLLATFEAPGQAIRCAAALVGRAAALGVQLSAGIHTGEVNRTPDATSGTAVQISGRLAALARPAEILVSRTVKDLVTGSGICFTERGSDKQNGEGESWPLFALTALGAATA